MVNGALAAGKPHAAVLKRPAPDQEPRMKPFLESIREAGTVASAARVPVSGLKVTRPNRRRSQIVLSSTRTPTPTRTRTPTPRRACSHLGGRAPRLHHHIQAGSVG